MSLANFLKRLLLLISSKRLLETEVSKVTGLEMEDLKTQSKTINYPKRVISNSLVENEEYRDAKHIIIEEGQFFPDLERFITRSVDIDNKNAGYLNLISEKTICIKNIPNIVKVVP